MSGYQGPFLTVLNLLAILSCVFLPHSSDHLLPLWEPRRSSASRNATHQPHVHRHSRSSTNSCHYHTHSDTAPGHSVTVLPLTDAERRQNNSRTPSTNVVNTTPTTAFVEKRKGMEN